MYGIFGADERLQYIGTQGSQKEAEDVGHDDYGCREFDLQTLLHAYDQGKGHRENGQKQLVVYPRKPAA